MEDKDISRFLFDKRHIRPENTIKFSAFMPPNTLRLSVYKTDSLTPTEIYEIGAIHVEPLRGKEIQGIAQISQSNVISSNLAFDHDGVPHERHSNIIGWHLENEKNRLLAMKLAADASLITK